MPDGERSRLELLGRRERVVQQGGTLAIASSLGWGGDRSCAHSGRPAYGRPVAIGRLVARVAPDRLCQSLPAQVAPQWIAGQDVILPRGPTPVSVLLMGWYSICIVVSWSFRCTPRVAECTPAFIASQGAKGHALWHSTYQALVRPLRLQGARYRGRRVAVIFHDVTERRRRVLNAAFFAKIGDVLTRLSLRRCFTGRCRRRSATCGPAKHGHRRPARAGVPGWRHPGA